MDIDSKIAVIKNDVGRIWKYLDKIQKAIEWKESVGTVSNDAGELMGIARYAGIPKKGEELESIMNYVDIAKQGIEEVEKALDELIT